jgi:low temperature requirement protein LtrA
MGDIGAEDTEVVGHKHRATDILHKTAGFNLYDGGKLGAMGLLAQQPRPILKWNEDHTGPVHEQHGRPEPWTDLFYDLLMVAAFIQFGGVLAYSGLIYGGYDAVLDPSGYYFSTAGVAACFLGFFIILFVWEDWTKFLNFYETRSVAEIGILFGIQLLGLLWMVTYIYVAQPPAAAHRRSTTTTTTTTEEVKVFYATTWFCVGLFTTRLGSFLNYLAVLAYNKRLFYNAIFKLVSILVNIGFIVGIIISANTGNTVCGEDPNFDRRSTTPAATPTNSSTHTICTGDTNDTSMTLEKLGLLAVGCLLEWVLPHFFRGIASHISPETEKLSRDPPLDIHHWQARHNALLIICLGESILQMTPAVSGVWRVGSWPFFWTQLAAIFVIFSLCYLYFSTAPANTEYHALRRHWLIREAFKAAWVIVLFCVLLVGVALKLEFGYLEGAAPKGARQGLLWALVSLLSLLIVIKDLLHSHWYVYMMKIMGMQGGAPTPVLNGVVSRAVGLVVRLFAIMGLIAMTAAPDDMSAPDFTGYVSFIITFHALADIVCYAFFAYYNDIAAGEDAPLEVTSIATGHGCPQILPTEEATSRDCC